MTSETRTPAQQCRCGHFDYNHWLSGKGSCAVPECDCNGFYAAQAIDAAIEPPEAPPDLAASVEALAETVAELTRNMANGFAQIDERVTAIRNEQTELRSGINVEVNSRIKRGHLDDGRNAEIHKILVELKSRLAALESPAAEPESVKSVFPRTYYVGVEKEPEYAPEPDPLCQCGHPKSEHFNRKPLVCCKWDYCCCEEFVPQASPATAHQEPPDAVRYYTIVLTNEQLPALNDCIFEGIANAEDVAAIEALHADIQKQLDAYFYGRDGAR